jgi:hypothetical protein
MRYRGEPADIVMHGLGPRIHAFAAAQKAWMPAPSAGMTAICSRIQIGPFLAPGAWA